MKFVPRTMQHTRGSAVADYVVFTKSGYVNSEVFGQILDKFLECLNNNRPGLKTILFMDNLGAHKVYKSIVKLMDAGILVQWLPANTSSVLQPLDDVPFGQLRRGMNKYIADFGVDQHYWNNVPWGEIILEALADAMHNKLTRSVIQAGFRNTGIYPFEPETIRVRAAKLVGESNELTLVDAPHRIKFIREAEIRTQLVVDVMAKAARDGHFKSAKGKISNNKLMDAREWVQEMERKEKAKEEKNEAIAAKKKENEARKETIAAQKKTKESVIALNLTPQQEIEAVTCRHVSCDKVYNAKNNPVSVEWYDCSQCGMFTCCSRHGDEVQDQIVTEHELACKGDFLPLGEKLPRPKSNKRKLPEPTRGKQPGEVSEFKKFKSLEAQCHKSAAASGCRRQTRHAALSSALQSAGGVAIMLSQNNVE